MAGKKPPRPGFKPKGSGRPRPGQGARPRPSGGRPTASPPPGQGAQESRPSAPSPPVSNDEHVDEMSMDLDMVPLSQADHDDGPGGGKKQTATQFFALPTPKRKEPEPEPPPPAASSAGMPPGMAPGMPPGMPPGMAPGMPPGGMGGMGIQGPVASGPMAGGPVAHHPYGAGVPPIAPPDSGQDRARSYRVFAVVAGLMLVVFMALLLFVSALVAYNMMEEDSTAVPSVAAAPPSRPAPVRDTAIPPPAAPKPAPSPRPSPSPQSSAPRPAPAPAPPPAPVGPAKVTVTVPQSETFTGIEVQCPLSSYRKRASFSAGVATLPDVPQEDCNLFFKGGMPSKSTIRGGQSKSCTFSSGMANCQ